jgi:hypothetical protein
LINQSPDEADLGDDVHKLQSNHKTPSKSCLQLSKGMSSRNRQGMNTERFQA